MRGALEALVCPRCRSTALRAEGPAFGCWRCGGVFLRGAAADSVRLALDPHAHAAAERYAGSPFARVDLASAAACPVCRATMRRFPAGPVDVDTCGLHGTWYDPGELCAVRDALLKNGARGETPAPVPLPPPAAPPPPTPLRGGPPLPATASLELAEVPRARPRAARQEGVDFDFKLKQGRDRAERDRLDAESAPIMLDVLGAVFGAIGITMPSERPPRWPRRHQRRRSGMYI